MTSHLLPDRFLEVILTNRKTLIIALEFIAVSFLPSSASAEQKAHDAVFYKGKTPGLRLVFAFARRYVEASSVKITESAGGKTTRFYLTGRDGQMGTDKIRFAPRKSDKVRKEVLLEIDPFGDPPPIVKGTYTAAGKTVSFALTKRAKH